MVCLLEHLTDASSRTRSTRRGGRGNGGPAASSTASEAASASAASSADASDEGDAPLPSLAERLCDLEDQNRELREMISRMRERSFASLLPADTMDMALFVAVTVLIVYVGRIASRI